LLWPAAAQRQQTGQPNSPGETEAEVERARSDLVPHSFAGAQLLGTRARANANLSSGAASRVTCAMPSFDIVSQVNSMEIENMINQARKELANRLISKATGRISSKRMKSG
jgi:hypothetical protein